MIKAYVVFIGRDMAEGELRRLLPRVSPEKRERAAQLRAAEDIQRLLIGDLLARFALSEMLGVDPGGLEFSAGRLGKPELRGRPGVHFNISHSGRYAVCVSGDEPVGIDVQQAPEGRDFMKIAERFFRPDERGYISSFPPGGHRLAAFTEIWAKKEAYVKREGAGLALGLSAFGVLDAPNAEFHKILDERGAVCYVCASLGSAAPGVVRLSADGFLYKYCRRERNMILYIRPAYRRGNI
ncbi:MAG: 4'-phosphopantetheinyl transferase superfamily protein [Oscillospiraceae bacterium]|nr:4'-phosphopantetheinyl transferase superfamily protein [Oscillospiraceae bacterium]